MYDVLQMYAGSGKWIDKAAWGTLFRASGDSMFCRMASTIYWTPDELRNRSVTGTLSNKSRSMGRTEARQAVTPEKLSSLKSMHNWTYCSNEKNVAAVFFDTATEGGAVLRKTVRLICIDVPSCNKETEILNNSS